MIGFGNDTLAKQPRLAAGDLVPCTRCGGEHRVVEDGAAPSGERVPLVRLVVHKADTGLVHDTREDCDYWHRICGTCERERSVPGDFPHCCPQQYQDGWKLCQTCGETVSYHALQHLNDGRVTHRPRDVRGRDDDQSRRSERGTSFCGPLVDHPDHPGYWRRFGVEGRQRTTLLSYRCGEESFLAGINGASVMDARPDVSGPDPESSS